MTSEYLAANCDAVRFPRGVQRGKPFAVVAALFRGEKKSVMLQFNRSGHLRTFLLFNGEPESLNDLRICMGLHPVAYHRFAAVACAGYSGSPDG